MTESSAERTAEDEMACPTCKARQVWSDQCRRCQCDLSLLRQWRSAGESQRRECLHELRLRRPEQALGHARRYALIVGSREGARLLAVCHLLCGNWAESCAALGEGSNPR